MVTGFWFFSDDLDFFGFSDLGFGLSGLMDSGFSIGYYSLRLTIQRWCTVDIYHNLFDNRAIFFDFWEKRSISR